MKVWIPSSAACLELPSFNDEPGGKSEFGLTWLKQHPSVSAGKQKRSSVTRPNHD